MIAAYALTTMGLAVVFFGPHVAFDEYSSFRLGAVIVSLAGTACLLTLVSFRYPESTQGNDFRVGIAMIGGIAATGVFLHYAGLFDADLYVLGAQTLAKWLTRWEGGWGQSFVAGALSILPAVPVMGFLGYLFNADASLHHWLHSRPTQKRRRPDDLVAPGTPRSPGKSGMGLFAKAVIIFGILSALFVGLLSLAGLLDNWNRNFGPGVIAMAVSAAVIVLAGGLLLRASK
ncbi:MAG TPA: hypothetical protein VMM16_06730 [Verrucomicrobiae bacterium]|nr:hypothetical protein [Verrucomicrobiae bacterium]